MEIYLFRHGETDWNKERRLQGHSDIPLNGFGRELAVETAGSLAGLTFDRAFSSPLKRAFETAQILLAGRNVPLETDERLMEMGFGDCEGGAFDLPKADPEHPLHDFSVGPSFFRPGEAGSPSGRRRPGGRRSCRRGFFRWKGTAAVS